MKVKFTVWIGGWEGIIGYFCEGCTLLSKLGHVFDGADIQSFLSIESRSDAYIECILIWILVPNWREDPVDFRLRTHISMNCLISNICMSVCIM